MSNRVSYINAVEQLNATKLPAAAPPLTLATLWQREHEGDTLEFRVQMIEPSGRVFASFDAPLHRFEKTRWRMNIGIGGFPVDQPGEYMVALFQKSGTEWSPIARLPLSVEVNTIVAAAPKVVEVTAPR